MKVRGQAQKKQRHKVKAPRTKSKKQPPVDLTAIDGRSLKTRANKLLKQRARAWYILDKLKEEK